MNARMGKKAASIMLITIMTIVACGCNTNKVSEVSSFTEDTEAVIVETTNTEFATTKTTESKTVNATTAATTEQTTEAITTTEVSTRSASASTTETVAVAQSTTESSTVQATTHAATEAPTTEHEHNWVIVTKTVEVPAETHTETHYFRKDNGQDVTGSDICGKDGKTVVQTGSYTVWECQCGFSGSPEEEAAHQREMQAGEDGWQHSQSFDHIEFTYAEVEQRTVTIVDKEATTIQIPSGYQCTICGATKESD